MFNTTVWLQTARCRRRARMVAASGALAFGVLGAASPSSAVATGLNGSCLASGSAVVTFSGGGPLTTETGSYTSTGHDTLCQMPDPTIHSGTETATGSGAFNCSHLSASMVGTLNIAWDNGRSSVATFTENVVGGVDHTTGVFAAGEFQGMPFSYVGVDLPLPNPLQCLASSGLIDAVFSGAYLFGG